MHKGKKKWISLSIVSVVIISLVIGVFTVTKNNASKSNMGSTQRTVQVSKGNIEVSLSGSGTVESTSTSDLMSNVQGKIINAYFNEGDKVKKGDLLFEIDDTDAKLNIQKIENSISQTQLSLNSNKKSYSNLTITAPFDGKISGLSAVMGESANNGMNVLTITDTTNLILSVPFSSTNISNIEIGQTAKVHVQEIMDTIEGTVTAIDDYTYTSSNGGMVRNVEITVPNPGRLTDEMTANVEISATNGLESGSEICQFEYANKQTLKASAAGSFSSVNVRENQYVKKGDILIQIENDDLLVTSQTNDLKIQDYNNQLTAAKKQLEDYKIYSPIDGTITTVKSVVGDSVKAGDTLISIRDFDQMQFTISIDELDISKVKVGQEATITIDALTETIAKPLDGGVIYKAIEGTSTNGVATYDVTIKINQTENLLAGMNANANIILNSSENVLKLPLEAITKIGDKAFVRLIGTADAGNQQKVDGDKALDGKKAANRQLPAALKANLEYYANTVMKEVELGINNDEFVEIKSGLSEGDVVVLPPLVASSTGNANTNTEKSGAFMMGDIKGVGGNMPAVKMERPSGAIKQAN